MRIPRVRYTRLHRYHVTRAVTAHHNKILQLLLLLLTIYDIIIIDNYAYVRISVKRNSFDLLRIRENSVPIPIFKKENIINV